MLNSFNSWMKPRKEGSTGDSQGGDTFLNVEKGCLFLLTAGYYEVWARATDDAGRTQPMVLPG